MRDARPGDDLLVFRWADLPAITADLPGSGGEIRTRPEHFVVREIASYLPSGEGSHAYARVRKRGLTTRDLVTALLREGLAEGVIGVAGLKDKYAVTEQWLSVPNRDAAALDALDALEGVEVLERSRHRNKLGVGHLRGNAFEVRILTPDPDARARAEAVLGRLARLGVPNYFGPQRFGRFGRNAVDGLRLVRGEWVPGGHRLKRFFVSALQSRLYNALLAHRDEQGLYHGVVSGDWARKHDTGGTFLVDEDAESVREACARAERLEICATLPLYGKKVRPSTHRAGAIEQHELARLGLAWTDFTSRRGDRRSSRVVLEGVALEKDDDGLMLRFTLPKGAYATSVLREVMKVDVDAPGTDSTGEPDEVGASEEAADVDGD